MSIVSTNLSLRFLDGVLQQSVEYITYDVNGKPIGGGLEWKDIPKVSS